MGRPLRIEYPDAFYHITARGNERQIYLKVIEIENVFSVIWIQPASVIKQSFILTALWTTITIFCCKH